MPQERPRRASDSHVNIPKGKKARLAMQTVEAVEPINLISKIPTKKETSQ